jgi:galactose mutarotase-like enzyme
MSPPPSGEQHEIRHGEQVAVVTEVGATLRSYAVGTVDVVDGFGVDEPSSAGRGQVLAPWPNRLDAGRYAFGGVEGRAPIDEPERGNAIHGLVRWLPWSVGSRAADAVSLATVLHPQPGYPWRLELEIAYRLSSEALRVEVRATNASEVAAPFGVGFHPYLTVGTPIDGARLTIPATRRLLTDGRGLPVGEEDVVGTDFDLRSAGEVGTKQLDTCFTGLMRDADGRVRGARRCRRARRRALGGGGVRLPPGVHGRHPRADRPP